MKATRVPCQREFRPRNISHERWLDAPRGQSICNASPGATSNRRAGQYPRYRQYGRDWLHPNRYAVRRGRPHGLPALDDRAILALLLSVPQGLVSTPCNWLSSNVPWPRARANTPCGISSTICCRSTRQPDGHFSESSPTEAGIFGVTADKLESGLLFRQLGGAPTLMPKMLQNQRSSMPPWCTICSWTERPRISGGAELAGHRRRACLAVILLTGPAGTRPDVAMSVGANAV